MGRLLILPLILPLLLLAACMPIQPEAGPAPAAGTPAPAAGTPAPAAQSPAPAPQPFEPKGFTRTIHDPVMAKEGDTWYVFSTGTHIIVIKSQDMVNWEWAGRVFADNPAWTRAINPDLGDMWAPDISHVNGEWRLYYAVSTFGSQTSAIGLVTNKTLDPASPDYAWVDQGEVLRSQSGDLFNAIDPNFVLDQEGRGWLAFGSFWQGIFAHRIDLATGKLDTADPTFYPLANRSAGPDNTPAIEAPFIVYRAPWYYLFVSFDQCCQGEASTYNTRVGRSKDVLGPYVDRDGTPMLEGGGTRILDAFGHWRGPGHNGIWIDGDGTYWMPYHAYHAQLAGMSYLQIEAIEWDAEGWPSLPSQRAP